ncbi:putative NADP-dependent alcohol dehydrogenase C 2 [Kalaharituber pfeilii]|nr:putative NADP-dependent alcohol dehydrogenase C 2 [Kalaharituber pfeilii]
MAAAATDYKFVGWMGHNPDCIHNQALVQEEFKPKPFTEDDVDIKISHCGICGSDAHTLRSGWGRTIYPMCVGHEIIGTAVRVGAKVKHVKVGDRVGLGAQVSACLKPDCDECSTGQEQYCAGLVATYDSRYPDGSIAYGGYANYARAPGYFIFKIPDSIPSEHAAPLLCAGATVYSPLLHNGCGPGKKVAIIGIGGLGHMGLLFAKALEADKAIAISRNSSKKGDAMKLGADEFIAFDEDSDWPTKYARSLDLIVCTIPSSKMPLGKFLNLLRPNGTFVQVGAPEEPLPSIMAFALIVRKVKLAGSLIASPQEIRDMLDLVAEKKVKPWVQMFPMNKVNEVLQKFEAGEPRYRFVLVNEQ